MTNLEITKYSKDDLLQIVKLLKKYRNLKKNIWRKSFEVINADLKQEHRLLVEYFPGVQKKDVFNLVKDLYKNIFWIEPLEDKITWKENSNLKWWARLFFWDDLLDISFESASNILRKI